MTSSAMRIAQQSSTPARAIRLGPGACKQTLSLRAGRRGSRLHIEHGCVWVTLEGNQVQAAQDLWLQAGQTLQLAPHQRLWVDGWPEASVSLHAEAPAAFCSALGAVLATAFASLRQTMAKVAARPLALSGAQIKQRREASSCEPPRGQV